MVADFAEMDDHSNERNLAHCAATAMGNPQQDNNHEVTKLKQEYERQIQTLKLEHKIQLLEMDNKMSKQILELQKENQSLKHENELMKLKGAHELQSNKKVVEANLEKQVFVKEMELKDKLNAKEKEITLNWAEKDKDTALKLAEKEKQLLKQENEHKIEIIKMKNDMEKTIESLRNENEMLRTIAKKQPKEVHQAVGAVTMKEEVEDPLKLPLMERLEWGVKCFIAKEIQPTIECSYEQWYQSICSTMQNKKLYDNNNFLFLKKNFGMFHTNLCFVNNEKGQGLGEHPHHFRSEGLDDQKLSEGQFFILSPQSEEKIEKQDKKYKGTVQFVFTLDIF